MTNLQDFIAGSHSFKKFEIDDLLFAEFKCPLDKKDNIWWHNNFFAHVLTGETILKTPKLEYTLRAGDSIFAKKGSIVSRNHVQEDFCELLVFVPDYFIKSVVTKYKVPLANVTTNRPADTIIPLFPDKVLTSYFQSLLTHFLESFPPTKSLLKLKFEELLLNILTNNSHLPVKNYFSELCRLTKPSIREIMEANFFNNLSLSEFARLCARSLTAFKKEFIALYNETPGKWLQEKRLEYSYYLLETTDGSLEEICMESGFENKSHFIRSFKDRYRVTPGKFKMHSSESQVR